MSCFIYRLGWIIEIVNMLVKVYRHSWGCLVFAFIFMSCYSFPLTHVLQAEFTYVQDFLMTVFLRIRAKIPCIDFISPKVYFFNIPNLCRLLMFLFKGINLRVIINKFLVSRINFILFSLSMPRQSLLDRLGFILMWKFIFFDWVAMNQNSLICNQSDISICDPFIKSFIIAFEMYVVVHFRRWSLTLLYLSSLYDWCWYYSQ